MSPLTKHQIQKLLSAIAFAFVSTFLGVVVTAGGISTSWEANIALLTSATVASINAALYATYLVFQTDEK